MQRCVASPVVETHGGMNCLALAIYWIDEEGCGRMLQEYEDFSSDYLCPD